MLIEVGKKAPKFKAEIEEGKYISLNEFNDKWIVLYFYPKDNTPGCTKEACGFRDNMDIITKHGAEVIGVSPDTVKSHEKFLQKYNLNFHLVSDPDKKICEKYGVIGEKNIFGKKIKGVIRSTFIIDPERKIRHVWTNVKVDGHIQDVINKLKQLKT
jgi:thioredoxin-dependent peroxiredoxin